MPGRSFHSSRTAHVGTFGSPLLSTPVFAFQFQNKSLTSPRPAERVGCDGEFRNSKITYLLGNRLTLRNGRVATTLNSAVVSFAFVGSVIHGLLGGTCNSLLHVEQACPGYDFKLPAPSDLSTASWR